MMMMMMMMMMMINTQSVREMTGYGFYFQAVTTIFLLGLSGRPSSVVLDNNRGIPSRWRSR